MHTKAALSVISVLIFGAQATWGDWIARAWDEWKPASANSSTAQGNSSGFSDLTGHLDDIARDLAEDLVDNIPDNLAEDLFEDIAEWENSSEWRAIAERMVEWNMTVWNSSIWEGIAGRMADLNRTMWNNSEMRNILERITEWNRSTWANAEWDVIARQIADWENSPEWRSIAERMVEWNKTVWNNSMWQHITDCVAQWGKDTWSTSEWECIAEHLAGWNTTMWNSSELENIAERIADWVTGMRRGHGHGRGGERDGGIDGRGPYGGGSGMFHQALAEEPEAVSGSIALMVSNASAIAADPEAQHAVRAALAELISIKEELIVTFSMTAMATNRSRRLTGAREAGNLMVRYAISGASRPNRIAAALKRSSPNDATRLINAQLQAANLPYTVSEAHFISVTVASAADNEPEEAGVSDMKDPFGFFTGILVGVFALMSLALCVGVAACVYRSTTKPRGPKVTVVAGIPCPVQDAVAKDDDNNTNKNDTNNNGSNNGIVMGHVVPESMKTGSVDIV